MSGDAGTLSAVSAAVSSSAPSAPMIPAGGGMAAAQKAGQDFEAFFMSQVFENMFSGVGSDPMFGGGQGEDVYKSLLIQEYSKVAAKSGSTGIGAMVTRQILQMQEAAGGA
jgi:Rod binding domain-containing protein